MIVAVIILVALGSAIVGFVGGLRLYTKRMLPYVLARMDPRELGRVAVKASKLRKQQ